mmetsp:Transcript_11156/g.17539  ORF Transcript_11156/g.17539 Transcript_11156/m.17539 type:complete len:215 (+) Transcript_11156:540-1184(+)
MEADLDRGSNASASASGTNKEFEEEKRKEQEKSDRQWGMMGLGQDNVTGLSASVKPWYASAQKPNAVSYEGIGQAAEAHGSVPFGREKTGSDKQARDERKKSSHDPMRDLNKYLDSTRKHKDKKKKGDDRHSSSSSKGKEDKEAKLAKMRAERMAREAAERGKVAQIMGGAAPVFKSSSGSDSRSRDGDDYRSGYSSGFAQFHGGLVRDKARRY